MDSHFGSNNYHVVDFPDKVLCKQNEAEKEFLEEELRSRGRQLLSNTTDHTSSQPHILSGHTQSSCASSQPVNSLGIRTYPLSHSTSQPSTHSDENLSPKSQEATERHMSLSYHTCRDINILKDLDKKLNKDLSITDEPVSKGETEVGLGMIGDICSVWLAQTLSVRYLHIVHISGSTR